MLHIRSSGCILLRYIRVWDDVFWQIGLETMVARYINALLSIYLMQNKKIQLIFYRLNETNNNLLN